MSDCPAPSAVLVADDDADIRALVVLALRSAGFETETVDSGLEALAAVERRVPHVLVLDVRMPDLSGLDVCRQVKSSPAVASTVLLISANSSMEDVAAGYAAGADDYLAKPFSPRELVQRVRMLVTRSHGIA